MAAAPPVSPARRARHRLRTLASEHPALARLRDRAQVIYQQFRSASGPPASAIH